MINGICEWKCFNYCENGGVCSIALKEPYCNCNNTGYHGQSIEQSSISCQPTDNQLLENENKKCFQVIDVKYAIVRDQKHVNTANVN